MYATKRRKRTCNTVKKPNACDQNTASNPSKRHRERLNLELSRLANLLPFDFQTIAKLDKLSILRLAVSYLRSKNYFQNSVPHQSLFSPSCFFDFHGNHNAHYHGNQELILQALHGFLMVVTGDAEIFYVSETVEQYLGFQQADIMHQSVLDLIHSEDRNEFRRNLRSTRSSHLHQGSKVNFMVRFRCLLSNASGFVVFEVSGKLKNIESSNNPSNALFVLCAPFGAVTTSHLNEAQDASFKSRHKMDMKFLNSDPRHSLLLKFTSDEFTCFSLYKLLHPLDVSYFSITHDQLMKTGQCTAVAYRLISKELETFWFQSECKVLYKSGRPDTIEMLSRLLTDEEGESLCCKRTQQQQQPLLVLNNIQKPNNDTFLDFSNFPSWTTSNNNLPLTDYVPNNLIESNDGICPQMERICCKSNVQSNHFNCHKKFQFPSNPHFSSEDQSFSEYSTFGQKIYDDVFDPTLTFDTSWVQGHQDTSLFPVSRSSVIHFSMPNKFLPMLEL